VLNNYKGFKKVHEDKEKAIMAHSNGHKIVIAKSGLTGKLKKALKALPLHRSGEDEADDSVIQDPNASSADTDTSGAGASTQIGGDQSAPYQGNPIGADNGLPEASNAPLPGDAQGIPSIQDTYNKAVNTSNEEASQKGKLAQEQQGVYEKASGNDQDLITQLSKTSQDSNNEINAMIQDTKNNYIKPNHYMESLDVPQKMSTAVGLILGGMGGLGKSNSALDFLNKQIDRDLESQKANQGTRNNLLSAMQEKYKNNLVAINMTKTFMAAKVADDLNVAAAKAGTPMAQIENQKAQIALANQYRPLKLQADIINTLQNQGQGGQSSIPPAQQITLMQRAGLIDNAKATAALHDVDVAEKTKAAHEAIDRSAALIKRLQTIPARALAPVQSKQLIDSAKANIVSNLMGAAPSKRFTPQAADAMVTPHIQGFLTNPQAADRLTQDAHNMIDTNADEPQTAKGLEALGLRLPKYSPPPVAMVLPNGKQVLIPRQHMQEALKRGAKVK
jgi:hypothetical protein